MLIDQSSELPHAGSTEGARKSQTRAEPRRSFIPLTRSLLPTGSPFGWSARNRALYVQFLTALLMLIVTAAFVLADGWPFVLEPPNDADALRTTKWLCAGALLFWLVLYVSTWRRPSTNGGGSSSLLTATIVAHIVTGTAACYALGPYTAASGLITVAALLLGMVLLRRRYLWISVLGWFVSMFAMHFASKAGWLPFHALYQASLSSSDMAQVAAERAAAAALIYIPLAVVMDHLIRVWRQDERSLFEAAQFDSLTGAYARGFAVSLMQRALSRAIDDGKPLAVLMVDLDHFKRINDAHGHALGDVVLARTTRAIQSMLRADDIVGRFGGEEFVVLLPRADLQQAMGAAERCRAAIESMEIPDAPYLSVTASVGVAGFPDHGDQLDQLLNQSDQAMYAAKARGRNRIESATSQADSKH
jgi:diguanylate cyclase (GGDEF)-like protein